MTLDSPITDIRGIGDVVAEKFKSVGIVTIADLVDYYPRKYDDYSHIEAIGVIQPGIVTIRAVIKQVRGRYVKRGLHITEAAASDASGSVRLVWFNQPYRANAIKPEAEYFISGQFELKSGRLAIMNASMELASDFPVSTARIVPIYRETKNLKSLQIRRALREVGPMINDLVETLPNWLVMEQKLMSKSEAIMAIHFPKDAEHLALAQRRLSFEEVFELTLASLMNKYELMQEHALAIPFNQDLAKQFVSHLPFKLTDAQRVVIWQIYQLSLIHI